ncbi:hypothetical protein [Streptomyces phytohabitans]|uniref:hypothetical protein n=1 Tax=Streptomyces phytohabitans TaxID=1150371 RepID=UPI00345BC0B2
MPAPWLAAAGRAMVRARATHEPREREHPRMLESYHRLVGALRARDWLPAALAERALVGGAR